MHQTDGILLPADDAAGEAGDPGRQDHAQGEVAPFAAGNRSESEAPLATGASNNAMAEASGTAPALTGGSDAIPDASADNAHRSLPPATQPTSAPQRDGLLLVLLSALIGGLILNLMPCVLPVLSLKAIGLAQSGESRAHAPRACHLVHAGGVDLVRRLRPAGGGPAHRRPGRRWGFQLQQPWFVAALVYLMFAVGLSLSGVFTLGAGIGGVGQQLATRDGRAGDFFTACSPAWSPAPASPRSWETALGYAFIAPPPLPCWCSDPGAGPCPAVHPDRLRAGAGHASAQARSMDGDAQAMCSPSRCT